MKSIKNGRLAILSNARPNNKRRAGFTLVEVIIATALLGLGIAMGFSALSGMTRTELLLREKEKMNATKFNGQIIRVHCVLITKTMNGTLDID